MINLDPRLVEQLIDLVPILVGAGIALVGGALKNFIDVSNDKRRVRREKLEQLLSRALTLKTWSNQLDDFALRVREEMPEPIFDDIEVLQTLYFPELNNEVREVVLATRKYAHQSIKVRQIHLDTGKIPDDWNEIVKTHYEPLSEKIDKLKIASQKIARKIS